VDFGLAEYTKELEKKGIDIVLAHRVFHSTHHGYGAECYNALLEGYEAELARGC